MQTHIAKRVEIVIEAPLERRLTEALTAAGVTGYTVLPVLGVPVKSRALSGLDSLLSIAQMPGGVPVGTLAIGESGAKNAALLACTILGGKHPALREAYRAFKEAQTARVLADPDPSVDPPS